MLNITLINEIIAACQWDTANFLIVSENVFDPFIYYSHIVPLAVSLLIGYFIFLKNPKLLINQILFFLTNLFALWVFFDLILWATDKPSYTIFFWSIVNLIEPFIYAFSLYFVMVFISGKDTSLKSKFLVFAPIIPVIVLAFTHFNLLGFNLANCDREAIEGPLAHYIYIIEVLYVIGIALYSIRHFILNSKEKRTQIVLVNLSIICFLITFSWGNIVGSLTDSWRLPQWGLFGMPIFIACLSYLIIKYNAFNIRVISTQLLVTAFPILVGSLYFLTRSLGNKIIIIITFLLSIISGIFIVRSVKREIVHRIKIEELATSLEKTNTQLKGANARLQELDKQKSEFLSFASHQLRSPLTAIKGYASLILDGDYGKLPEELKHPVQVIFDSTSTLASVVTDYLNVSRIELGQIKYDFSKQDMKKITEQIIDELKPNIDKAGLKLNYEFSPGDYNTIVDKEKIIQVITNIVDNSIKYTKKGSISVGLSQKSGKILISVKDTGIGISKENLPKLFSKFVRATNANQTNSRGTGLGLYIARDIIEKHKGKVWVESQGEGMGSQFYIEIPVVK